MRLSMNESGTLHNVTYSDVSAAHTKCRFSTIVACARCTFLLSAKFDDPDGAHVRGRWQFIQNARSAQVRGESFESPFGFFFCCYTRLHITLAERMLTKLTVKPVVKALSQCLAVPSMATSGYALCQVSHATHWEFGESHLQTSVLRLRNSSAHVISISGSQTSGVLCKVHHMHSPCVNLLMSL